MKQLTQAVFGLPECPEWALSAAVDKNGKGSYYADVIKHLEPIEVATTGMWIYKEGGNKRFEIKSISGDFDATDWQNSAIDRGVIEVKLGYACGDCGYHHEPHQMRTTFCEGCDTLLS